jgi:NAD(P)-dependent dehydrogenase (short-subunit alcohol dehydrogenase family)
MFWTGKLTGKRAVITGGDSGIGRAVAIAFAREGADVLISYLADEEKDAQETIKWIKVCTLDQLYSVLALDAIDCDNLQYIALAPELSAASTHGVYLMELDCSRETRA